MNHNHACPELDCNGTLEQPSEPKQTSTNEHTEGICSDCNHRQKIRQCPNCNSTLFDHTETITTEGWIDPDNMHTKNTDWVDYRETHSITCNDCGYSIGQ